MDLHKDIRPYALKIEPVGSRVTCNPAPTDTDQDYLVLFKNEDSFYDAVEELRWDHGFEVCGDSDYFVPADEGFQESYFQSFRKGDLNYILTFHKGFFEDFMKATAIAKEYNLLHKHERVSLFQWVLYDSFCDAHAELLEDMGSVNRPPTVEEMIEVIRAVPKEAVSFDYVIND